MIKKPLQKLLENKKNPFVILTKVTPLRTVVPKSKKLVEAKIDKSNVALKSKPAAKKDKGKSSKIPAVTSKVIKTVKDNKLKGVVIEKPKTKAKAVKNVTKDIIKPLKSGKINPIKDTKVTKMPEVLYKEPYIHEADRKVQQLVEEFNPEIYDKMIESHVSSFLYNPFADNQEKFMLQEDRTRDSYKKLCKKNHINNIAEKDLVNYENYCNIFDNIRYDINIQRKNSVYTLLGIYKTWALDPSHILQWAATLNQKRDLIKFFNKVSEEMVKYFAFDKDNVNIYKSLSNLDVLPDLYDLKDSSKRLINLKKTFEVLSSALTRNNNKDVMIKEPKEHFESAVDKTFKED